MELIDWNRPCTWRHVPGEVILLGVRWSLRQAVSYRNLEEMLLERGLTVDHTTIQRWVQAYAPAIDRRMRPHLKRTNDRWRVDETYSKVKEPWMSRSRASDATGAPIDCSLRTTRNRLAAQLVLLTALGADHPMQPRVITTDQSPVSPQAIAQLVRNKH